MKKIFALLLCVVLFCNDTAYATLFAQNATATPSQDTTNTQDTTETKDAKQNTKDSKNAVSSNATTNPDLTIESASAVLIEGSTGSILYEKNKDERRFPASITKIMTLVLIFEALDSGKFTLSDKVTVSEHAASMGGSQVYLEPNETQTAEDMIKCITIASANDACVAMAEFIAGSETEFVAKMNQKAAELGMKNTKFMNCCGLDDTIAEGSHYSSAYDIALMSRELITKHPEITKYSTTWMDSIIHVTKKGETEFGLTNTNKLVRTYTGITGLKTGSTSKAKYCLSASANRNNMDLIAVVMAAPEPKQRFAEAASMLDYGFANCSMYKDENKDVVIKPVKIKRGKKEKIKPIITSSFNYLLLKDKTADKITKKPMLTKSICAPVKQGDQIGEMVYSYDGEKIGSVPIVAAEEVKEAKYIDFLEKAAKKFFISEE
ncbi:MAG TPA: D-alanyl-D-alanine carboxypeptidase [Lachnospiraceae bacterium]|nr:D-alanyl-D-alanine carboxypeptidase family protein [uncultured Lachnoclostridium sp.]HAU86750.1 D-alanyl-D-alanine carboxypeptidase [Lachnospiraceae bacterium]